MIQYNNNIRSQAGLLTHSMWAENCPQKHSPPKRSNKIIAKKSLKAKSILTVYTVDKDGKTTIKGNGKTESSWVSTSEENEYFIFDSI